MLVVLGLGFVWAPAARSGTFLPFGSFTESPNQSPNILYDGDTGNLYSEIGTGFSGLAGSFRLNSSAVHNLPSGLTGPITAHLLFYSATAVGGLQTTIDQTTGAVAQAFTNPVQPSSLTIIRDSDKAVILQLTGFVGTFQGTLGQSTGTFTGQLTLFPHVNETSGVGLALESGDLTFTVDLTDFSAPLSVNTGDAFPNVLKSFSADDPTSFTSTGTVGFGASSVPEPASFVSLLLGLACVTTVSHWLRRRPHRRTMATT
jgi:hypothetical protein